MPKKILKIFFYTACGVFLLMNLAAFTGAFLFTSMPASPNTKQPAGTFREVSISSASTLNAWWMEVENPKASVILFHGYGAKKSMMLQRAEILNACGYNTLLVDFRGCGNSEGRGTSIGYFESEDVTASVKFLQQKGERNIILFGSSMGAVAIMKAMTEDQTGVASLVLECPFRSMLDAVEMRCKMVHAPAFPVVQLMVFWGGIQKGFNAFDHRPSEYAKKISLPVLLLYGDKDNRVAADETASIYENLPGEKYLQRFPQTGHTNFLEHEREKWTNAVCSFLASHH